MLCKPYEVAGGTSTFSEIFANIIYGALILLAVAASMLKNLQGLLKSGGCYTWRQLFFVFFGIAMEATLAVETGKIPLKGWLISCWRSSRFY